MTQPNRITVWILGDQLLAEHPSLAAAREAHAPSEICVLLIESGQRLARHPYHRQKLVLLLSAMRHYAARLESQGYTVDYRKADDTLAGLRDHLDAFRPNRLVTMQASEHRGRRFQAGLSEKLGGLPVAVLPNTQFLLGRFNPIPNPEPEKRYVMEHFYRAMRTHFGLLMDGDEPTGGEWNYDKENRKPLPKGLAPPEVPGFEADELTSEVIEEVRRMPNASGSLDDFLLAVTHQDAEAAFEDFLAHRLADFGPYEDAMSREHATLFHSVISPYLNLGLLEPLDLAQRAEAAYRAGRAPINSVEGFIRQVIGWREYIYWQYHRWMPGYLENNFWDVDRSLPEMFWDAETEMNCLATVFRRVIDTGYAHHIERLMLVSNFSLLAGLSPRQVHDWFLCSFIDAYEWVMAPNVIGMGLYADGGLVSTKPYIASANYIHRMSDYCGSCSYDRKTRTGPQACPFNYLYWNFLLEYEGLLRSQPRMGRNVLGLRYLDGPERLRVRQDAAAFLDTLG